MRSKAEVALGVCLFIISIIICNQIVKANNDYNTNDYFARVCGQSSEVRKCVYMHIEHNPFTSSKTFYYQVTEESIINGTSGNYSVIQEGSKSNIEEILDIATGQDANGRIQLGDDYFIYIDDYTYKQIKKGDSISREELLYVANELED